MAAPKKDTYATAADYDSVSVDNITSSFDVMVTTHIATIAKGDGLPNVEDFASNAIELALLHIARYGMEGQFEFTVPYDLMPNKAYGGGIDAFTTFRVTVETEPST